MIAFDPETHRYTVDGRIVRWSVTKVIDAVGLGVDYSRIPAATLCWARERGKHVELCCRFFDEGILDWTSVVEEAKPYVEAWQRMRSETGFAPVCHQPFGYSEALDVCGAADVFGTMRNRSYDLEVKCTASVSRAYGLQVAGQLELTYPGWDTPSHRALVQLCKDGSYQLFTDDPQDERGRTVFRSVDRAVFKACVEVVRWKDAA